MLCGDGDDTVQSRVANTSINGGNGNDSIENYISNVTLSGGVTLNGGMGNDIIKNYLNGSNSTIIGGKGDDSIYNSLSNVNVIFQYIDGDGNDVIKGFNDTSTLSIADGSYSSEVSGDDVIVTVGDGKISLIGAASLETVNIDGKYFNPYSITLTKDNDTLKNMEDNATIDALGGNDSIRNYGDEVSVNAGAGNDSIRSYGDNSTILGGAGNDTIRNYGFDVTISSDAGNDTIYNYGEDVLIEYNAGNGNDKVIGFNETSTLQIGDGTGTYATQTGGSDVIVYVGSNKITLKGAAALDELNINGEDSTNLTLTDADAAKITLKAGVQSGYASARTKAIKLVGNALDNTILGGSGKDTLYGGNGDDYLVGNAGADKLFGQNGNDSLWGGIGNDTLTGGAGADTFIYNNGEGKDVITDFGDDDLLQITGTFSATYNESKNTIAFKVGTTSNAITLKNFTATSFNINGDIYAISGKKLVKQ